MMFQRKKKEEDGLDIIENVKEPFSFQNFMEEHVVTKWKQFRKMLEERGILFFLISPFQYRNRLIVKIALVIIGVFIGIVPRTFSLIEETKERNASSEIASIADGSYANGNITIRPLDSGQYEKQHVLAFLIEGDTSNGVPSTTDKYDVVLSVKRGVTGIEDVKSTYEILPINASSRLLIVYVDNREQSDKTGNYNLLVKVKNEELDERRLKQMEIILSDNQKTTALFNGEGIHLSALSNKILSSDKQPIEGAKQSLEKALEVYAVNEDRLAAMGMQVGMSSEQLRTYANEHLHLPELEDTSNNDDIKNMTYDKDYSINHPMTVDAAITYDGTTYSITDMQGDSASAIYSEVNDLSSLTNSVLSAVSSLNSARSTKYTQLLALQNTLNQTLDIGSIKGTTVVTP